MKTPEEILKKYRFREDAIIEVEDSNIEYNQMEVRDLMEEYGEQLLLHNVRQQRELLGCEHNVITIIGRDEGKCADCGIEMIRTWQPNCS